MRIWFSAIVKSRRQLLTLNAMPSGVVYNFFWLCVVIVPVIQYIEAAKLLSPVILKAESVSSRQVELEWQDLMRKPNRKFSDRKFYSVRYFQTEHRKQKEKYFYRNTKRTKVTVSGLTPDTSYTFSVKTTKGKKISGWSNSVSRRTLPQADIENLKTLPLSSTAIKLTWQLPRQPDNRSYGYEIFWQEVRKDESPRRTIVSNSAMSHTFNFLIPDRQYSFRVQTLSDRKTEMKSETVFERTYSDKPSKPPRDITMHVVSPRIVLLKWNPPPARKRNGDIVLYKIQYRRKTVERGDLCVVNSPPVPREYNLTDLAAGATYKVRISAKTVNGTGPFSKWESVILPQRSSGDRTSRTTPNKGRKKKKKKKKPDPPVELPHVPRGSGLGESLNITMKRPESLVAKPLSSTSVRLSWREPDTSPCCPIIAYGILVRSVKANAWERDHVTGIKTEAVIKDLDPGTLYAFNITAFNTRGSSEQSDEVFATTLDAVHPEIDHLAKGSFIENQGGSLVCVAHGDPIPDVFWYRENATRPFYTEKLINQRIHNAFHVTTDTRKDEERVQISLVFSEVSQADCGIYICLARNVAGNVTRSTLLEVNVPPTIIDVHNTLVTVGDSTNMTCAVKGIPLPMVSWIRLRDLAEIKEEPKASGRPGRLHVKTWVDALQSIVYKTLFIATATLADAGNYSCTAISNYGSAVRIAQVRVEVPPPPSVENLHAIALSPSKVSLYWTRPSGYMHPISMYRLTYRRADGHQNNSFNITNQRFDLDDLVPDTAYKVMVTAFNMHGREAESKSVEVKTLTNKNLEPANVSAIALNSSIIQLDWAAPRSIARMYIKGYHIYYKRDRDTIPVKLFIAGNTNKQFLIGLGKEDTYFLKIATVMSWGAEWPSQWIKIKKQKRELTPPNPPRNLTAVATTTTIKLSWKPPTFSGNVDMEHTGYRFAYGMESVRDMKHWNISEKVTSLTLKDLVPGTLYKVYLQATNADGESDTVYRLIKTLDLPPGPVLRAVASPMSSTEILVQWIAPNKGYVTRYHVRYWRPGKRDKESAWLYYPNSQYIAGSLRKNSAYRFEVIPYNRDQAGETTVLFATTMVDRPEDPPRSVKIKFINATAMTVHWEPPRKEYQNGPIAGYKIVFKLKGGKRLATFSVDGDRRNYTFKGLEPSQTYKVHVAAMTAKGAGPYSKWAVATTDKIDMRPPESPSSIQISCTANSIRVWWTPPRDIGVPVNGYILGYGRYIPEVFRSILGPATYRYTITNLRHKSEYIISVRAFNNIGESSPKFLVGKTKEDLKATFPLKAPTNIKATTLSHNEMALSWFDPSLGKLQKRVDKRYYLVRFSAVSNDVYRFVNATRSPYVVRDLMVFTKYEFSVRAVRGEDQSGWSLPQFNKTSPTAPLDAPRELTVLMDSKSPSTLTITWQPPQTPNGIIEEYFLYKTSDPTLDLKYWVVETTPGTKLTKTINNVTPHTTLHFRVQARNVAGYGPLSEVVIYSPVTDSTAAPSNVSVSALNGNRSTSIEVSWDEPEKPTAQITGYIVYYRVQDSDGDDEVDVDDLSWMVHDERGLSTVILDLQYNMTYEFKVGARYSGGFGPVSEVVLYRTPAKDDEMGIPDTIDPYEEEEGLQSDVPLPPFEITAEGATNSIRLAWIAPPVNKSAPVEFYRLGYGELFPDTEQIDVNATESSYIIEHLRPHTTFIVSVRAVNVEGSSQPVMTTVKTTS